MLLTAATYLGVSGHGESHQLLRGTVDAQFHGIPHTFEPVSKPPSKGVPDQQNQPELGGAACSWTAPAIQQLGKFQVTTSSMVEKPTIAALLRGGSSFEEVFSDSGYLTHPYLMLQFCRPAQQLSALTCFLASESMPSRMACMTPGLPL